MSNNNTSNDNKDVDLNNVLECFKQRGVDIQNKIDETKGVNLNEVIKCLEVPMNKPYKIKDTKLKDLKSSRLQVSKSIFEYAQGGEDNEKTYGFIKWYEQAKNNKTIKNVINYIRYKLKKFILNYEYLIKNRENILKTGIKLSENNPEDINTSDLKSYFYNHRNVANLLNKNVTTIKKDDKNKKEYNFFDYLKKIYGVFGKFYEEDYGDFIQDDVMMNDKFFDHKFFIIYNVWIFINYYTTQNASLLNEVQDKITRAFRDYFLNINESFNHEDHEFGQLLEHIFLITNAQKEYLKNNPNKEDTTDMNKQYTELNNKEKNDKKILTREKFDTAFFEVINKNKSLNCYIFPPELFLKLWNEEELYIYFKRDTGSIQGSNDIYEYNSVPEEGRRIDQIDDKLVYLILKDEDDLLIKDKDYLNVQEKDNFSVISRLFNENVFHKQSGTEPINVSDLLRVLAMKDQNTKIIETYLKDGIENAKKMIDDIKNSATEAFKNVSLSRNKVYIAPPDPPASPASVGGANNLIQVMNFDFEFDKYTFKQLLKDKGETSQINEIRNALSSRGEESIKKSIKKLIDNYKRRRFVISYNYTQEGDKNNKKYKCKKTEKKAKQNKYDSCYPIDGNEIFSITKEVEIVSLKSQFKSENKVENAEQNAEQNVKQDSEKDPNIMKKDNILGLEIESIQQDGDCFFTAAAKAFPNSNKNVEDRVKELREIAANNLEEKDVKNSFQLKGNIFEILKQQKLDENKLNEELLNNSILIYIYKNYKNYNDFEEILENVKPKKDERGSSFTFPSAQILNGLKQNIKNDKTFWADEQIINILKTNLKFNTYKYSENGIEQLGLDNIHDNNVILQYQNGNHYNIYKHSFL